jgi:succinate dehydrogenase/fumarate reductase flavoprotein subunit
LLSGGVFAGTREGVSTDRHLARTLQAGRGINRPDLAAILAEEGPMRLRELKEWGVKAEFYRGYLFSKGRAPVWGEEIVRSLLSKARMSGIRFMGGLMVTDLKSHGGNMTAVAYSAASGKWLLFDAKALILATGGAGALYLRHNNPPRMLGEGYALALRAGALLQDMEFVQFYPIGLAEPNMPPTLITPRLTDLGRLYNGSGQEILEKYDIKERPAAERARDRLSQALFKEIQRESEAVWLDLQGIQKEEACVEALSASIYEILEKRFGAIKRPMRVAPMTHHVMGGISIDPDGATSVPGLFAAGEVTGGLHGANRLGGNALTETMVFGARAGYAAASWARDCDVVNRPEDGNELVSRLVGTKPIRSRADMALLMGKLRRILWEEGGILRNEEGLKRAIDLVRSIREEVFESPLPVEPRKVQRLLELRLCTLTADLVLQGALRREESRGAHFREDFPGQDDDNWRGHLQVRLSETGEQVWRFQPAD